jgi:hypothetical protein
LTRSAQRPAEDVEIAAVRIAPERLLHLLGQAVHAAPQVRVAHHKAGSA